LKNKRILLSNMSNLVCSLSIVINELKNSIFSEEEKNIGIRKKYIFNIVVSV